MFKPGAIGVNEIGFGNSKEFLEDHGKSMRAEGFGMQLFDILEVFGNYFATLNFPDIGNPHPSFGKFAFLSHCVFYPWPGAKLIRRPRLTE